MAQSARKPTIQAMCYIGREMDWTDGQMGAQWPFGCLPGGCTPNAVTALVSTGFAWTNGNTGYTVQIGTKALPQRWFVQGFGTPDPARIDKSINADVARPMVKDSECFVSIIPDDPTAVPTQGHAILWLSFLAQPLLRDANAPWS